MYHRVMGSKKFFFTAFLLLVGFIGLSVVSGDITIQLGVMGTIVTFIYGFFMDGLFKFIESKYLVFKQNIAGLSASARSLFCIILLTRDKRLVKAIKDPLKNLLVSIRDSDPELYEKNKGLLNKVFLSIGSYNPKDFREANLHREALRMMEDLAKARDQLEVFGDKYIRGEMKFLFLLFPVVLILLIILISWHSFYLMLFGFILMVVLVFNAFLIYDVDNLHYGNYHFNKLNIDGLVEYIEQS